MADIIQNIFKTKKLEPSRLEPFGFERSGQDYVYHETLPESGFFLTVTVTHTGDVSAQVFDPASGEPYTLHLADGAAGSFVGAVRSRYEAFLTELASRCFVPDVFKSAQTKELIAYVKSSHGDELEFLWEKLSDSAIWRRKDTGKWYAVLLIVPLNKLGLNSGEMAEIIDLRTDQNKLEALLKKKSYFPGYHMNKKHWYSILLDGSVPFEELCRRLEESYQLALKR